MPFTLANLLRQIMGQIGKIAPTLPTQPTLNPTNPITDPVSNIIDDYDPVDEDDDDIPDDPEPPVIDPIDPIDPVDPENPNPNNLRLVQWSNFFPFCIPFDLFAALKLLRAKPQDPIWEIPIHLGYKEWVLIDYTLVIDLTSYGFSEVWAVVRTGEVIGFIFLLGVITKKFVY